MGVKPCTYRHLFGGLYINFCCFPFKGEAVGMPGSRVPYQRGNFTAEVLPEGVKFKNLTAMGHSSVNPLWRQQIPFL